ncbi:hypothetical protein Dimus_021291 [Dionaea muscipula]
MIKRTKQNKTDTHRADELSFAPLASQALSPSSPTSSISSIDNPWIFSFFQSPRIPNPGVMGPEDIKEDTGSWQTKLVHNQWVALPMSGPRPSGRYKHAAAVLGEKLYISGGSRSGRHLSDIQVLDLTDFTWSSLGLNIEQNTVKLENGSLQEVFPAISGHDMVIWGKKLLVLGGQHKTYSEYVTVRFVDLEALQCGILETTGKLPVARGGQSFSLVGSKLIMFGGEDTKRRLLNDIHILDLVTLSWTEVETTQPPPSPRYDHAAAVHAEHYLLIFGGCSHSTCFNDVHVLDLQTMEWSQPENRGDFPTPRAGHSGVVINDQWFLVGGGDNKSGALETIVLDLTKLVWSVVTRVNERDPLASEGISLCAALIGGVKYLVAFGGYNGKYNNEVFIMKPRLTDPPPPKIFQSPAAAAAAASVSAAYLIGSGGSRATPKEEEPSREDSEIKHPKHEFTVDVDAVREENRVLESSLAEVREENSKLRGKFDDVKNTHAELSKELLSVQAQLADERSRCFKLEAQIAELRNLLQSSPAIEAEVLSLRRQISMMEQTATTENQASRGVWGWIGVGDS